MSNEPSAARAGDMGEGRKLVLFKEEDGDIIVSVIPIDHKFGEGVQFCTPGSGGGASPTTWEALLALWRAMHADNVSHPLPRRQRPAPAAPCGDTEAWLGSVRRTIDEAKRAVTSNQREEVDQDELALLSAELESVVERCGVLVAK